MSSFPHFDIVRARRILLTRKFLRTLHALITKRLLENFLGPYRESNQRLIHPHSNYSKFGRCGTHTHTHTRVTHSRRFMVVLMAKAEFAAT
jgi:hypothetical protein